MGPSATPAPASSYGQRRRADQLQRCDHGVTGTSPAFTATGGGTVTATSLTNSLTTTSGVALDVSGGSVIGSAGLEIASLSAGDATHHPTSGIVLSGTGGAGNVTIAGGTIQRTTGAGIQLAEPGTVSLAGMTISAAAATASTPTTSSRSRSRIRRCWAAARGDRRDRGRQRRSAEREHRVRHSVRTAGHGDLARVRRRRQGLLDHNPIGNVTAGSGSRPATGSTSPTPPVSCSRRSARPDRAASRPVWASPRKNSATRLDTRPDDRWDHVGDRRDQRRVRDRRHRRRVPERVGETLSGVVGLLVSQPDASGTFAIEGYTGPRATSTACRRSSRRRPPRP